MAAGGILPFYSLPRRGCWGIFPDSQGWITLRVLNAPSGAKVYVDDIPSGVPQRDGTIIVQGLRTGEARDLRVSEEGYADWKTTVTGQPGKVVDVTVNLTPLQTKLRRQRAASPQKSILAGVW